MIANFYDVEIVFNEADFDDGQRYTLGIQKNQTAERVLAVLDEISGILKFEQNVNYILVERR